MKNLIAQIEKYISDYVTLADSRYSLPIALWSIGTYCFEQFDAFPYLVITSSTKRSGKTRLSEMLSFHCSNPRPFAALTAATMFRCIESESPTLIFDEAETLSSEAASTMRAVLNVGYRRGQTVPRVLPGGVKEFSTYCPKVFVLIGDVYDTLRDRSIVITMKRAETNRRFMFDVAKDEGRELRELITSAIKLHKGDIQHIFENHKGLPFLMDRDEEIWTSLFCLAEVFCKPRLEELQAIAADMCTDKTQAARKYVDFKSAEENAMTEEYSRRLLLDVYALCAATGAKAISTQTALEGLKAIPTGPWRRFKGEGIDAHDLSNMLSLFGLRPVRIATGSGRGNQKFSRGYKRKDVEAAMQKL